MRGDDGAQAASSFQNGLSVGSPCQPDHQAGHERIPRTNRILDDYFWSRSGNEIAPTPQRGARCGHRDANPRRFCCFRENRTSFRDSFCIARWIGCRLAGSQPGSDLAYFVMIQLDDISAGR